MLFLKPAITRAFKKFLSSPPESTFYPHPQELTSKIIVKGVFPFSKITAGLYQFDVQTPSCPSGPQTLRLALCPVSLTPSSLPGCAPLPISRCLAPQYPSSFSHTPSLCSACPFPAVTHLETPASFYGPAHASIPRASLSHASSFTWSTHICGGAWVPGVNDTEVNSEVDTLRHTSSHLETRRHYQVSKTGSLTAVPLSAAPGKVWVE